MEFDPLNQSYVNSKDRKRQKHWLYRAARYGLFGFVLERLFPLLHNFMGPRFSAKTAWKILGVILVVFWISGQLKVHLRDSVVEHKRYSKVATAEYPYQIYAKYKTERKRGVFNDKVRRHRVAESGYYIDATDYAMYSVFYVFRYSSGTLLILGTLLTLYFSFYTSKRELIKEAYGEDSQEYQEYTAPMTKDEVVEAKARNNRDWLVAPPIRDAKKADPENTNRPRFGRGNSTDEN